MSDILTKTVASIKAAKIIPDVINDDSFVPSVLFSVVWPSTGAVVILGEEIQLHLTVPEPRIRILPMGFPKSDASYTLVMTDPDAPKRSAPENAQWRHWVLPGVKLPAANINETEGQFAMKTHNDATQWSPPAPPKGKGLHRYVFLLFEEPAGGITISGDAVERKSDPTERQKWDAMKFASSHNLKLVGVNYFETKNPVQ